MLGAGAFTENFRTALNGFNRTDVVNFIQRQTVEYEKSLRILREENARLKQSATEPKFDTEALLAEADVLNRANEDLKAQIEFIRKEKAALVLSLEEAKAKLAAAEKALEEAQAAQSSAPEAVPALDRPIAAPAGLTAPPSNFDDLELAAYRRAEQTERMARERATAAAARIQNVYHQADEKMTLTAADMALLLENLNSNYEQMKNLMESARSILAESAESLKVSADLSSVI